MMKKSKIAQAVCCLALALLPLAGGAAEIPPDDPSVAQKATEAYVIGPGDVLGIEVWKDPALTRTVTVLPDGTISFPLIGKLDAAGKTVGHLKVEIEAKIDRYVPDTVLTVEVKQSNSMFIYVLGRVNSPGRFPIASHIDVLQGLAMAGGLNPFAKKNEIKVFRRENGVLKQYPFAYGKITSGKDLDQNIELQRGDVIFVP